MRTELQNGTILKLPDRACEYAITKLLGRGASCFVYLARYTENGLTHEVILKEYNPKSLNLCRDESGALTVPPDCCEKFNAGMERFEQGYKKQATMRLNSDVTNSTTNIQGIHFANNTRYIEMTLSAGVTYQIDDHATDATLYDFLRRMRSLSTVIGHYHAAGYLHLDIKPDNIFAPKSNDGKDVILFDFDSMVEQRAVANISTPLSYTKEWAAMEQLNPAKRMSICKATDIFSVGEMIFYRIFGRHSTLSERRSYSTYRFDHEAAIFRNVNPKVFPLLNELLKKTLCNVVGNRYQTTDDLIAKLDEIIKSADPKEPFLKTSLPALSGFFTGRDAEIQAIHNRLTSQNLLFLSGIGGIGKSELAKHFADEYQDEYDAIIFAPFVNDVQMMIANDNYVPICNFSQYPEEKPDEYFIRKMRELGKLCNNRTLLIVDNLDTTEDPNLDKLFKLGCKMLVTTRMDFSDVYADAQIDVGTLANPVDVFNEHYKKPLSDEDRICVGEIIEIVCGHTMTVELLAKQMMAGRVKPEKMLAKLKEGGISDSGKEKVRTSKDGDLTPKSTFDHIQALFDLSELNEDEKYVLANLSLIPHTGISAELFCEWCEIDNFDTINHLATEGWVRWNKKSDIISLHPLLNDLCTTTVLTVEIIEHFDSKFDMIETRPFTIDEIKMYFSVLIYLVKVKFKSDDIEQDDPR